MSMTKRHISRSAVVLSDAESVRRPQLRWRRPERLRRSSDGRRCSRDAIGTLAAAPTTSSYFVRRQRHPRALLSERAENLLVIDFHPQEDSSAPQVMTWDSLQIRVEESSSAIRFGTRCSRREKNQKRNLVSKMMYQCALCSILFKHPSGQFLWHFQQNFETRLWVDKAQA